MITDVRDELMYLPYAYKFEKIHEAVTTPLTGYDIPRNELIKKETLDWMDRYLGPAK